MGLVNEILDAEGFDAGVRAYASKFLPPGRAAKAVGHIKRAVISGLEAGFHEGLAIERELQQRLFESEDAREGLAAYVERRPPKFRGR
jgi:enoyl-CoA hydratase/carnithine racemase